jgi:hypothetical protein
MKFKHHTLAIVMAGLISLTGYAAIIMDSDDFEHDAVDAQPTKATLTSPAVPTVDASVLVVDEVDNRAGTGKSVSLLDYDTSTGLQIEYDFTIISDTAPDAVLDNAARLSAVRVDLSFAPLSITTQKNHYLSITLGEHLVSQSDSATHFLDCRLYDNGTIDFISSDGSQSIDNPVTDPDNTLSIFANDYDTQNVTYLGPDGASYDLPPNSVAYWLNGSLITFGAQEYASMENRTTSNGDVLFTSTNNLGRFAIVSTVGSDGLDYVFDDIKISDLDSAQDPTGTSWLVSESLTGLIYTGYANQGQTNPVNTVPDYSGSGYQGGGVPIPFVPAAVILSDDGPGDDAARIQAAINTVSGLPLVDGFRGAVVLEAGYYEVNNTLSISTSGVVIRGAGSQENGGTRITFTSTATNKPILFFVGNGSGGPIEITGTRTAITDAYVPVGAKSFTVEDASGYAPGDAIIIQMMVNDDWLFDISDMAQWGWTTGYYQNMKYRRIVTAVNGNEIAIDVPVLQAIENQYG